MITRQTLHIALMASEALRRRGEHDQAAAIEALVAASVQARPAKEGRAGVEPRELFGASGRTIKRWVRRGRPAAYHVGGWITVPEDAVAAYTRRARRSLDLDEVADEEAARLVGEGRRRY